MATYKFPWKNAATFGAVALLHVPSLHFRQNQTPLNNPDFAAMQKDSAEKNSPAASFAAFDANEYTIPKAELLYPYAAWAEDPEAIARVLTLLDYKDDPIRLSPDARIVGQWIVNESCIVQAIYDPELPLGQLWLKSIRYTDAAEGYGKDSICRTTTIAEWSDLRANLQSFADGRAPALKVMNDNPSFAVLYKTPKGEAGYRLDWADYDSKQGNMYVDRAGKPNRIIVDPTSSVEKLGLFYIDPGEPLDPSGFCKTLDNAGSDITMVASDGSILIYFGDRAAGIINAEKIGAKPYVPPEKSEMDLRLREYYRSYIR